MTRYGSTESRYDYRGMKRLLLVTYAFPPQPSPGALRPGYLARYLPEFGWDVTVLTRGSEPPPFPARIIAVGKANNIALGPAAARAVIARSLTRRILGRTRDCLAFPDDYAAWISPAIMAGLRAHRTQPFDAIISTALPMSAHVVGGVLARLTGLPWIADYRDAWATNPYMPWGRLKRRFETAFEQRMVARAACITTVSDAIAQQLARVHGRDARVVLNGYDASDCPAENAGSPAAFDLIYTGNLYDGKRSPELIFEALQQLRAAGHPAGMANVHFYSANNVGLPEMANRYGVDAQVKIHGMVPRAQVLKRQREAALLLILLSRDAQTVNEIGSKYLEYATARRPMLVCGPQESVMRDLVKLRRLGWFASDVSQAKAAITAAYELFVNGQGEWNADLSALPSAHDLARRFAACLDAIARKDRDLSESKSPHFGEPDHQQALP